VSIKAFELVFLAKTLVYAGPLGITGSRPSRGILSVFDEPARQSLSVTVG
jgi:hypothetical protein